MIKCLPEDSRYPSLYGFRWWVRSSVRGSGSNCSFFSWWFSFAGKTRSTLQYFWMTVLVVLARAFWRSSWTPLDVLVSNSWTVSQKIYFCEWKKVFDKILKKYEKCENKLKWNVFEKLIEKEEKFQKQKLCDVLESRAATMQVSWAKERWWTLLLWEVCQ